MVPGQYVRFERKGGMTMSHAQEILHDLEDELVFDVGFLSYQINDFAKPHMDWNIRATIPSTFKDRVSNFTDVFAARTRSAIAVLMDGDIFPQYASRLEPYNHIVGEMRELLFNLGWTLDRWESVVSAVQVQEDGVHFSRCSNQLLAAVTGSLNQAQTINPCTAAANEPSCPMFAMEAWSGWEWWREQTFDVELQRAADQSWGLTFKTKERNRIYKISESSILLNLLMPGDYFLEVDGIMCSSETSIANYLKHVLTCKAKILRIRID